MIEGTELKREIIKLLREDEEFRLAVAGLLGMEEILRAIRSLQEQVAEHSEAIKSHSEVIKSHSEVIESHSEAIRSHSEAIKSLQEQVAEHTKAIKSLQEQVRILQEQMAKHSEAITAMQKSMEKLSASITALGYRYGVYTEDIFREAVKYLIEDLLRAYEARRWIYYDSEGIVFGHPSVIEVDVLVRDREHILVEYKASIDKGDIAELAREGKLYEKVTGIKPRLLIVGPVARRRAVELKH